MCLLLKVLLDLELISPEQILLLTPKYLSSCLWVGLLGEGFFGNGKNTISTLTVEAQMMFAVKLCCSFQF